jgi:hypothetical protein
MFLNQLFSSIRPGSGTRKSLIPFRFEFRTNLFYIIKGYNSLAVPFLYSRLCNSGIPQPNFIVLLSFY